MEAVESIWEQALVNAAARGRQNCPEVDGDYRGDDGLLYCGKCRTPKECEVEMPEIGGVPSHMRKFPVLCECASKQREAEDEERRRRAEMDRMKELRSCSLMEEKFREARLSTFITRKDNGKHFKLCRRYVERFAEMVENNQGLLFYGDRGTGKSWAAACIANGLMDKLEPVVMTSLVEILKKIDSMRGSYGGETEEELIHKLNRAKLLILDDLGAERRTDFALEKVYSVIDSRYRAKKPMILTTNLTLKQMQEETDIQYARIYDRIFEVCYPVQFTGASWRKVEAAKRYNKMEAFWEEDG